MDEIKTWLLSKYNVDTLDVNIDYRDYRTIKYIRMSDLIKEMEKDLQWFVDYGLTMEKAIRCVQRVYDKKLIVR